MIFLSILLTAFVLLTVQNEDLKDVLLVLGNVILFLFTCAFFINISKEIEKQETSKKDEIKSLKIDYKILSFIVNNPAKFKNGDRVGCYIIESFYENYDSYRNEVYRTYLIFNTKINRQDKLEEIELVKIQKNSDRQNP